MHICWVHMKAKPGHRSELMRLCREGIPRAEAAGCERAELLLDTQDPDTMVMLERWPSREVFQAFSVTEFADEELMASYLAVSDGLPELRQYSLG